MSRVRPSLEQIADQQWRDYQARNPGAYFAEFPDSLDLTQAYALQDAVSRLRTGAGDVVIGYKVGCTGPGMIEPFGMEGPVRGCLFRSELRRSGDLIGAQTYAGLAVEGEMAVRIGADGELAEAFPVIELHNFVFRGPKKTLPELVGNNALNAGVVLPVGTGPWSMHDAASAAKLMVRINSDLVGEGGLWPRPGGAQASVAWLRGHLAEHNLALAPDHLVLTGTALGLYPVRPGDHISVGINGVSAVQCQVT